MEPESCFIPMADSTRVNGKIISNRGKATKGLQISPFIKALMPKESLKATENISGKMARFTKANGSKAWKMGPEYGEGQKATPT